MAFQPRLKADGTPCCFRTTQDGRMAFPANACQPCKDFGAARYRAAVAREQRAAALRTTEDTMSEDYTPPNPYAAGLASLRAAEATPESRFAEQYAAERLRALAAERAALDAHIEANPFPRLTAAEAAEYAAPNGYQLALDKMRSEAR